MLLVLVVGAFAIMRTQNLSTIVFAPPTPQRVYHIGILSRGRGSYEDAVKGFQDKMRELGYVEGQNVTYDIRYVSTKDEIKKGSDDLINAGVDLISTYSTPVTGVVYEATHKMQNPIPIVFGSLNYPVASGFIESVEHPGSNATGIISLSTELTIKRIELLTRVIPGIKKIAMPRSAEELNDIAANNSVALAKQEAKRLGIELVLFPVRTKEEIASSAASITAKRVQGIIVGGDSLVWSGLGEYIKQAIKEKIPLSVFSLDQVKKGALIGFGADYTVMGQQVATISHQILQGRKPGDMPVEIPSKLLLAINLDTARAIGITIDPQLLKEADVIIGK